MNHVSEKAWFCQEDRRLCIQVGKCIIIKNSSEITMTISKECGDDLGP